MYFCTSVTYYSRGFLRFLKKKKKIFRIVDYFLQLLTSQITEVGKCIYTTPCVRPANQFMVQVCLQQVSQEIET